MVDLIYLDESQNAAFDKEYHSPGELSKKLENIAILTKGVPFELLDLGGGNGRFLDAMLQHFPLASSTLMDISPQLLSLNRPHPKKHLVLGDIDKLESALPGYKADIITLNWLLHHLVGRRYSLCEGSCVRLLVKCRHALKDGGSIIVAENMFDGLGGINLPSRVIYAITRIKAPWFVAFSRRFFNTAGVGVCFRSSRAWRKLFRKAGLRIVHEDLGYFWNLQPKRFALSLLGIQHISHRHFYLQPV